MAPSGRLFQGVKHVLPNVLAKSSKGAVVYTECGRSILDFSCGIGVTNLGHSHDGVTKAAQEACGTLVHCAQNIMRHSKLVELIDKLTQQRISRSAKLDSWFFWNSGSEAVEAAIKLARHATGKQNVIAMNLGYHGRTFLAMALTTSSTIYRSGFGPLPSGVHVAPFPYISRGPYSHEALSGRAAGSASGNSFSLEHGHCHPHGAAPLEIAQRDTDRCLEQIELMLRTHTNPAETAAILIEPVLGEGGYTPAPPGFMTGLRKICDQHKILLIVDEVQTGFGRTGTLFASEWVDGGTTPDILIMAKGLANGFPISAIGTRSELSALQPPGSMGGTYGGNGVAVAAAVAVLDAFSTEGVLENVKAREVQLRAALSKYDKESPGVIREVRGKGLMIGVELEPRTGALPGSLSPKVVTECHQRDLLVLSCGPYDTIRLIPPLNVTEHELAKGAEIFLQGLSAAVRQ